jgi:BirA family transcriptional regulator, biotin operon repressor / biotin---[acetyl-CoA-carboxylase] ligase
MRNFNPGIPLIHLQTVDSTNVYASRLLQEGEVEEGTVILADHQVNGKGQGGSEWLSDNASNLLFSLVLKPSFLPADRQFYLSMCISNSLAEFLSVLTTGVSIKWPNDILVGRNKIAGILIENTVMGEYLNTCVIGIGLNINQAEFPAHIPNPVSLRQITGIVYDLPEIREKLFQSLATGLDLLYDNKLEIIRTAYLNKLSGLNKWAYCTDITGRFEGRIIDVADSGELMVMIRDGNVKKYGFREVSFEL